MADLFIQSTDLIRFIMRLDISSDATVSLNLIDDQEIFESDFFPSTFAVSSLALRMRREIQQGIVSESSNQAKEGSFTRMVMDSDLQSRNTPMYILAQIVTLESFSLIYFIQNKPHRLLEISPRELRRIRDNINVLADYFSTVEKYRHMIPQLRNMDLSIGYMENQIPRLRVLDRRGGNSVQSL